MFFNRVKENRN